MTETLPKNETFGLSSQIKRAAISIPSNIAEGQGRDSGKEFLHHLSIAYGSLMEVETQTQIALNVNLITSEQGKVVFERCNEVGRLLNGLLRSLRSYSADKPKRVTGN